jgi:hypothetical protein
MTIKEKRPLMAVSELVAVVPPPENPTEAGPPEEWPGIESAIGIPLPLDVRDFGLRYGSGMFADTVEAYNPFSAKYLEIISQVSDCYRDLKCAEGDKFIPYRIYPDKPGLLVWGSDVNGHMMFWLTEGEPSRWPLILMTVDGQFERWDMPMTTFLASIFQGKMSCILWDEEWIKKNFVGITFHPN